MNIVSALFLTLGVLASVYVLRWGAALYRSRSLARGAFQRASAPGLIHIVIGFVTNFFDTLGIGSFATTMSTYRLLGLVPDERIPGTMLVGHTLPVVVQAFAFISMVSVDRTLLVSLIVAMMVGGPKLKSRFAHVRFLRELEGCLPGHQGRRHQLALGAARDMARAAAAAGGKGSGRHADPGCERGRGHWHCGGRQHGRIPRSAWVLLRTGWSRRTDAVSFINAREDGPHSPGFDARTSKLLAEDRDVLGVGVETIGTDSGQAGTFNPPFPNHTTMHGAGKFGLASLCNLDQLPPTGAIVIAAPLKIVNGSGSPLRVIAITAC